MTPTRPVASARVKIAARVNRTKTAPEEIGVRRNEGRRFRLAPGPASGMRGVEGAAERSEEVELVEIASCEIPAAA